MAAHSSNSRSGVVDCSLPYGFAALGWKSTGQYLFVMLMRWEQCWPIRVRPVHLPSTGSYIREFSGPVFHPMRRTTRTTNGCNAFAGADRFARFPCLGIAGTAAEHGGGSRQRTALCGFGGSPRDFGAIPRPQSTTNGGQTSTLLWARLYYPFVIVRGMGPSDTAFAEESSTSPIA